MLILLLAACGPEGGAPTESSDAMEWFLPAPGAEFELVDPEAPDAEPLLMRISDDGATWELRLGSRWADAPELARYSARSDAEGFWLDSQRLLPPRMRAGLSEADLTVLSVESTELYYGTFPRVAIVETLGGPFEGEQGFAEDIGPVLLTLDGQRWELATYW
ncbi:MAG: hypothetical protein H6741_05370 [Alphaproteobacteria bacterium]|nr:hypothetical protein [Alphaproteobacteria bacterium]MCB9792136.1 hypothetical protein [Alphaproteobacteria bacterium]